MIRIVTGFDQREAVGWHAFAQSVIATTIEPFFSIAPLIGQQRDGTNAFTYSRFLVPHLCGFEGFAIFVDGCDMIARRDFAELWALRDPSKAVQVVKHDYKTRNPRKYIGTEMEAANEDYPRKNWSSVVIWNCAHPENRRLTPEFIDAATGAYLHRFAWLTDDLIGDLPLEWNWLADEYGANINAALLHWTAGIPAIPAHIRAAQAGCFFYHAVMANQEPAQVRERAAA